MFQSSQSPSQRQLRSPRDRVPSLPDIHQTGGSRPEFMEEKIRAQERNVQELLNAAYVLQERMGEHMNRQQHEDPKFREIVGEQIRTITTVCRKLNSDIEALEQQIRQSFGITENTAVSLRSLHSVQSLNVSDLASRLIKCEATINTLTGDRDKNFLQIQKLTHQMNQMHNEHLDKVGYIGSKLSDMATKLEMNRVEQSMGLKQAENDAGKVAMTVENRLRILVDELRETSAIQRQKDFGEIESTESRMIRRIEEVEKEMAEHEERIQLRFAESMAKMERRIAHLENRIDGQIQDQQASFQSNTQRFNKELDVKVAKCDEAIGRVKKETREQVSHLLASLESMKALEEGKRHLLEDQLRSEMKELKKIIALQS